jgi:hypothetical protein
LSPIIGAFLIFPENILKNHCFILIFKLLFIHSHLIKDLIMSISEEKIADILVRRDGLSREDAEDRVKEAEDALQEYLEDGDMCSAYNICEEYFGLEPDYLEQLNY